jgi:hypothetical protein
MELRDPDFNSAYDAYIESHLMGTGQKGVASAGEV